jgi:lantibiotic modifying enzyme
MRIILNENVNWIVDNFPPGMIDNAEPEDCGSGVFYGAAGRALLFLRLSDREENFEKKRKLLQTAHSYVENSLYANKSNDPCQASASDSSYVGFLKGLPGFLSIYSAITIRMGERDKAFQIAKQIERFFLSATEDTPFDFDQGLSGLLYNDIFLMGQLGERVIQTDAICHVFQLLYKKSKFNSTTGALEWHEREWSPAIGVGVGNSGAVLMLSTYLHLCEEKVQGIRNSLKKTLDYYVSLQSTDGNMPSDLPDRVQWCHGAPGFVAVFAQAYRIFKDPKYLNSAIMAANYTIHDGIIRKGMQLGHGVSGNMYMVASLYSVTGDLIWIRHALGMMLTALSDPKFSELQSMDVYDCVSGSIFIDGPGGLVSILSDWLMTLHSDLASISEFPPMPAFGEILASNPMVAEI